MSEEPVPVYDGPTPLADLLREALAERGIQSIQRAVGPFLGIIGDAARTPFSLVLVSGRDWEHRREQIDECLALVLPTSPEADEVEETGDDPGDLVP